MKAASAPRDLPPKRPFKKRVAPYIWFIPATAVVGAILFYPLGWSLVLSFSKWSLIRPGGPEFTGIANYVRAFQDPLFLQSLKTTGVFLFGTVLLQLVIGFGLAVLLDTGVRAKNFFLTCLVLPYVLSPAMSGLIWRLILHEDIGVANYLLAFLGLGNVGWLSDPQVILWTIIIIDVWRHMPFTLLIMWAGLQAIPQELYEAAQVDGANAVQRLRFVTIPALRVLFVIVVTFRTMYAIRSFDIIDILYPAGGPGNAGRLLGVHLNEVLKTTWSMGYASSIAWIMLIITFGLSFAIWFSQRRTQDD